MRTIKENLENKGKGQKMTEGIPAASQGETFL